MECDNPTYIRYEPPRTLPGPIGGPAVTVYGFPARCGKCIPCLKTRKAQWSFRLMEERRASFSSAFVTLTYKDRFLPFGENGPSVNKEDHKDFIKWLKYYEDEKRLNARTEISEEELQRIRLGIKTEGRKLKYYGVTEYGDREGRPHLHYLLFNVVDFNNIVRAWSVQMREDKKSPYYPGESKGKIDIDEMNVNTVDYVLKYMLKHHRDGDTQGKEKELSFMSKGLGACFVDDATLRDIQQPDRNLVVNSRGGVTGLPRYYNKKFLTEEERNRKSSYIRTKVQAKKDKDYATAIRNGIDYDKKVQTGKAHRYKTLITRTKNRDLK